MYSEEIKNNAIKLLQNGKKVSDISNELGISKTTLYSWRKKLPTFTLQASSQPIQAISGARSTDKKFVPSDNSKQLAEEEFSIKRDLIITKNQLIGTLLKEFSLQKRKNYEKAEQTEKDLSSLIDEVLSEDPNNIYTISYAIKFSKIRGNISEAIRFLQRKLEITPNDPVAIRDLETLQKNSKLPTISNLDRHPFLSHRHSFLSQCKQLKEIGDLEALEALEALLRDRLSTYPRDNLLKNQLAGVLLDKIELNPDDSLELLEEARQILYELREASPNNLRVSSNLIRLEKLANNEQSMEDRTRHLIAQDPSNYKAKTQLTQILLNKCKKQGVANTKKQCIVQEINSLLDQVLSKVPNNPIALNQSIELARLLGDLEREETLLRQAISLVPTDFIFKSRLTGVLLSNYLKGGSIDENVSRLLEAEQLALDLISHQPKNLYTITYLIRIAHLQGNIHKEKQWLELKLSINPNDTRAEKDLEKINKKLGVNPPPMPPPAESPTGTPRVPTTSEPSPSLMSYKTTLMNSIKSGDNQSTLNILNQMLQDTSIDSTSKKKIRVMIDLARSNKPRSQIALRTKIQDFR